jgi:hypothetical protein
MTRSFYFQRVIFFSYEVTGSPLGTAATVLHIVPALDDDDDDCGAIGVI